MPFKLCCCSVIMVATISCNDKQLFYLKTDIPTQVPVKTMETTSLRTGLGLIKCPIQLIQLKEHAMNRLPLQLRLVGAATSSKMNSYLLWPRLCLSSYLVNFNLKGKSTTGESLSHRGEIPTSSDKAIHHCACWHLVSHAWSLLLLKKNIDLLFYFLLSQYFLFS